MSVCRYCKERKVGCHCTCERYKKEAKENERIRQIKIKEASLATAFYDSMARYNRGMR